MTDAQPSHLSPEQCDVLFRAATERPFSGTHLHENRDGSFVCANCGAALFDSAHKYESGSGWPSFDQAIDTAIALHIDTSHGMRRVEITCAQCGGHLGHLFPDGPTETTGQRYCVNSLSLEFRPRNDSK